MGKSYKRWKRRQDKKAESTSVAQPAPKVEVAPPAPKAKPQATEVKKETSTPSKTTKKTPTTKV